uniref:Pectinesterase inhibitor domain-containing protein n=1 Tax=Kalanchoe fedtschenkoi TaxID=63787 RepID=A0A7N0TFU7_KALFE
MAPSTSQLVFLVSLIVSTSHAIPSATISQICSKAINPSSCLALLNSAPGVGSADLKGVGAIVLDAASSKASQAKSILPSLASKAGSAALKQRYTDCLEFYDEAVSDIGDAKQALKANDLDTMNASVSAAQTYVGDCTDSFDTPPADPSDLPKRNKDAFDTLSVALVVSNMI